MRKSLKNRAVIPRSAKAVKLSKMESHLESLGYDTANMASRARSQSRGRSTMRETTADGDAMELDDNKSALQRAKSRARSASTNRRTDGVTDEAATTKAERMAKLSQRKMNRMARQGEADRHQTGSLIKHLVSTLPASDKRSMLTLLGHWKAQFLGEQAVSVIATAVTRGMQRVWRLGVA
jgi:nucleolar GTP-binding protein